ncbi:hypothetical protein V8D89_016173 [Ganoderma adspersum]
MAKSLSKFFKTIRGVGLPLWKGKESSVGTSFLSLRYILNVPFSDLPIELWLGIFEYIDKHTLVSLTQVNQALCEVAEPILYNTVTLRWEIEITKFLRSVRSSPHRAGYVFSIALVDIDKQDQRIHEVLPSLLNSLQYLQYLRVEEIPGESTACCTAISSVRLPQLRTFVAGMRSFPSVLLDFLVAHQNLQEMDLCYTFVLDDPSKQPEGTVFSALRTLTCRTPFLNCRPPISTNLTRLYRPSFMLSQLPLLATHAGPQLVSLRLGNIFPLEHFQSWSLLDVVSNFPRLRFLHVDMTYEQTITPGLDTRLVDWYHERPGWLDRDLDGRPRLTLAWTYGQDVFRYVEVEVGWDRYLDDDAFHVLREWEDCVERVVYGVGGGPYTSTALGAMDGVERQLVKIEDKNMHEGYWKCV